MYKGIWGALAVGAAFSGQAFAVTTDGHEIPYVAAQYAHEFGDNSRDSKGGNGYQLTFGMPLSRADTAIEAFFYDVGRSRKIDGDKDYQTVLGVDLVRDLGLFRWSGNYTGKYLPGFKPFGLIGLEAVHEDVRGSGHYHVGGNLGAGMLFPLPWYGAAVRTEGRVQAQANKKSADSENVLLDYRFTIGVQIPLTPLFRDKTVPAPAECGVQVVDLNGAPRTDCGGADSDHDGVPDTRDHCPGTIEGLPVGPDGCPAIVGMAQPIGPTTPGYDLKGVHFETASALLTAASRPILDDAANSLKAQPDIKAEVAGYTDSKGGLSYNLELSQHRAESVRQYLIGKGIDGERLSARGYGEAEAIASNDTEEGREANRRVEIKVQPR
jgi:OOP family OmpA-OmpF porin